MSTADASIVPMSPSPFGVVDRLFTAADLAAMPEELPSGPVRYELDKGRLAILSPTGHRHGNVQTRIGAYFFQQGEQRQLGKAYSELGVVISRNPDTVYGPDVAFFESARLPIRESKEGFSETIPDVVVEIKSKNDTNAELKRKAQEYLKAGVKTVWIVDESTRSITIEEPNGQSHVVHDNEPIPAPAAIPGFELTVDRVFD